MAVVVKVAGIVEVIVAAAVVIDFVDVLSDMSLDAWIDALASVIIGFMTGIGVEVLPGANGNGFASLMTALEFAVPKPLEALSW